MEIKQHIEDILPTFTGTGQRVFKLHITASGDYNEINWLEKRFNEMLANPVEKQVMPKIAEFTDGYRETLKYDLEDAIEQQEQQNNEKFNAGREEALKYAIEMIDKHLNTP